MKVQVVRLRREGVKLENHQLEQPQVCLLDIKYHRITTNGTAFEVVRSAQLTHARMLGPPPIIPSLSCVELTRCNEGGMVLAGTETALTMTATSYPQAWWVRPV